jgi:FAD/FMN-containing dehydrogenase
MAIAQLIDGFGGELVAPGDAGYDAARAICGALLGELDTATQRHGLVVPAGVVSHTGVGGLTLGGGVGRLMRRFGLTVDSLRSAEVVTADGRLLRASADEHPDLFWGIRGGGGNFGIVTEFEFAAHQLSELLILGTFHHLGDVPAVLGRAQATIADEAPDELLWTSFLRKAPPLPWMPPELIGTPGVMSLIEWSGPRAEGVANLKRIAGELRPAASALQPIPFLAMQTMTDEIFGPGKRTYIKAGFVEALTDELIAVLAQHGARVRSPLSQIEVLSLGGAIARVPADATAFPHRDAGWLINLPAMWEDVAESEAEIAWTRGAYAALQPHMTGGTYVNFIGADGDSETDGAYGATLERLRAVKRRYDPENVFRLNQNILP